MCGSVYRRVVVPQICTCDVHVAVAYVKSMALHVGEGHDARQHDTDRMVNYVLLKGDVTVTVILGITDVITAF